MGANTVDTAMPRVRSITNCSSTPDWYKRVAAVALKKIGTKDFHFSLYTFKRLLCTYLIAALSDNLLVATYALLLSKLVRHCHLRDPRDLESPRALSSALGTLQPRALGDSKSRRSFGFSV